MPQGYFFDTITPIFVKRFEEKVDLICCPATTPQPGGIDVNTDSFYHTYYTPKMYPKIGIFLDSEKKQHTYFVNKEVMNADKMLA